MQVTHLILICLYIPPMVVICLFGIHRLWVLLRVLLTAKANRQLSTLPGTDQPLPTITVQLPMYNEAAVAQRAIDAACRLDYPILRLQIQVLDDSDQEQAAPIQRAASIRAAQGHQVQYLHRTHRRGYKAGALADGMKAATGEFIVIFDADFVPEPDFIKRLLPCFDDPEVGMAQARWSHLNTDQNLLTRAQATLLNGHFLLEQNFRALTGRWFNFNGTAGIWRRRCIEEAGGWQQDTLTEDTDLSYRAQLNGWKFVYRPDVKAPAELPPTLMAFCQQQHRWNKGLTQTAIKLTRKIILARAPMRCKFEAILHLFSPSLYLAIAFLALIAIPATLTLTTLSAIPPWLALSLGASSLALGMAATGLFYLVTQLRTKRAFLPSLLNLPILLALGIGVSLSVSRGVLEALVGHQTPFIRTPKFNSNRSMKIRDGETIRIRGIPEILIGSILIVCFVLTCIYHGTLVGAPFVFLFSISFGSVGFRLIKESLAHRQLPHHAPNKGEHDLPINGQDSIIEIDQQSEASQTTETVPPLVEHSLHS